LESIYLIIETLSRKLSKVKTPCHCEESIWTTKQSVQSKRIASPAFGGIAMTLYTDILF